MMPGAVYRSGVSKMQGFLRLLKRWAKLQADVTAVALVGSHARGTAKASSDVDIVIITSNPGKYLQNEQWMDYFGEVASVQKEDWGLVQSRRVRYLNDLEVEYGITTPLWACTDPLDAGTKEVVAGGMRIIFERGAVLSSLEQAIRR